MDLMSNANRMAALMDAAPTDLKAQQDGKVRNKKEEKIRVQLPHFSATSVRFHPPICEHSRPPLACAHCARTPTLVTLYTAQTLQKLTMLNLYILLTLVILLPQQLG